MLLLLLSPVMLREGFGCHMAHVPPALLPGKLAVGGLVPSPPQCCWLTPLLPGSAGTPRFRAGTERGGPGRANHSFDWREKYMNPYFLPSICFVTNLYT